MINSEIRKLRERIGEAMGCKFSQEKFGALLGVSYRSVNRWEKGLIVPDDKNIKNLKSLELILEDEEKRDEILSYLKNGNINAVTNIIGLVGAAIATAAVLPMAGLGVVSFISSLMKKEQEE